MLARSIRIFKLNEILQGKKQNENFKRIQYPFKAVVIYAVNCTFCFGLGSEGLEKGKF